MLTIAASLFALGFFLVVHANLQRVMAGWSDAAELSVYLQDDATAEQIRGHRAASRPERSDGGARVCLEGGGGGEIPAGLSRSGADG